MKHQRSLYCCANARVYGERIYCSADRKLSSIERNGNIHIRRLVDGDPLEFAVCQDCSSFAFFGPPVPKEERGWNNIKEEKER